MLGAGIVHGWPWLPRAWEKTNIGIEALLNSLKKNQYDKRGFCTQEDLILICRKRRPSLFMRLP
jgi:hypothetical protein